MSNRDLLDISLGHKPVTIVPQTTGTFLDRLPKDILQYLQQYTGPMDCFYLTHITHDYQGRRVPNFHVWVNKTQQEAQREAHTNGFYNNQITQAQVIFIDGKPHLTQPIETRKLYGMPRPPKRKRANTGSNTVRCIGATTSGKRCKHRTSNANSKCSIHANQQ